MEKRGKWKRKILAQWSEKKNCVERKQKCFGMQKGGGQPDPPNKRKPTAGWTFRGEGQKHKSAWKGGEGCYKTYRQCPQQGPGRKQKK